MAAAKVFIRSVHMVLFTLFRGRYLAPLLISVMVPSAILSVMMCTSSSLEAGVVLLGSYVGGKSLVLVNRSLGSSCIEVDVAGVAVASGHRIVNTSLYVVDNISRYVKATGLLVKGNISYVGGLNVSVGAGLASLLNLSLGSQIKMVYGGGGAVKAYIVAIHSSRVIVGKSVSDYLVVGGRGLEDLINGTRLVHGYLCSMPRSHVMASILEGVGGDIDHLLHVMIVLVVSSYVAVIFSSLVKVSDGFSGVVAVLLGSGLSRRMLRASYMVSLTLAALMLSFLGLSLGVIVFHFSLWVLRFIGLYLPVKPLPSVSATALTLLLTSTATLLASYATSSRIFQEDIV